MKSPRLLSCLVMATLLTSLYSCDPKPPEPRPQSPASAEGWAPVYGNDSSATHITSLEPRNIDKGGKIYVKGDTLYQVETGKGIHVIDIRQVANPQKVAFISVTGAQELAIKDNVLYTNNINDLVVLDISNTKDVKLLDRITNVFHMVDPNYPPGTGYFECVDVSKGKVVGWEQKTLKYPQCSN